MNFYDRLQTLLESQFLVRRRTRFRKFFLFAALLTSLGFNASAFAESIKLGYAALSGAHVAAWMAKESGYFSKYGIEAELIYIPAIAATQALIAGEIQLA